MHVTYLFLIAAAAAFATSCGERAPAAHTDAARSCDSPDVREVVERLGQRMKQVSLLAPDSIVVREIQQAYAPLVTPDLLEAWISEPARAPGREVSSPWPERIEIRSIESAGTGLCRVEGEVVYATSAERTRSGVSIRKPVVLSVRSADGWRIGAYEAATPSPTDSTDVDAGAAADVIPVLRRTIVNGASAEERRWHIYSANIVPSTVSR
jgi:hypothetical protein